MTFNEQKNLAEKICFSYFWLTNNLVVAEQKLKEDQGKRGGMVNGVEAREKEAGAEVT